MLRVFRSIVVQDLLELGDYMLIPQSWVSVLQRTACYESKKKRRAGHCYYCDKVREYSSKIWWQCKLDLS